MKQIPSHQGHHCQGNRFTFNSASPCSQTITPDTKLFQNAFLKAQPHGRSQPLHLFQRPIADRRPIPGH